MKLAVVGLGYVGLTTAIFFAQHNDVVALDLDEKKISMVNQRMAPFRDEYITKYLKKENLHLYATLDAERAYTNADFVIIAVPTNYDMKTESFDTTAIETVIETAKQYNSNATIVIKSTVPIGYTQSTREKFQTDNIIYNPEFLRESFALYDNLYPSRIVIGCDKSTEQIANTFALLCKEGALKKDVNVLPIGLAEAEAVKLFSNAYLALRISYFNELDTYAEIKGLDSKQIIDGICLDPRIGNYYNNPSFGYGGYCLPKDTQQLLTNYFGVPENLIRAIVKSNQTRKNYIADRVLGLAKSNFDDILPHKEITIGIFRLIMKNNSDNFRHSAILDIIRYMEVHDVNFIIYEPILLDKSLWGKHQVVNDLTKFKKQSTIIIANRYDDNLSDVKEKVYSRDLYQRD